MSNISTLSLLSRAPGTAFRELDGKMFIVGHSSSKLVMLNDTGSALWRYLQRPRTLEDLAMDLAAEFDVTREQALEDCQAFLGMLHARDLIFIE